MMVGRSGSLAFLVILVAVWEAAALNNENFDDPLLVETTTGPVRGAEARGLRAFRGIPYARPPTAALRWRPPQPMTTWVEERDATDFGATCMSPRCWESENMTRVSEDCLFVNVLTPYSAKKMPVLIYIHAGEFHCGSSNDAESNYPQFGHEVVYVSFNYRIGPFGFFGSEELRTRDPKNGTGNYGMLDQRLAICWVKENIDRFGGDPDRITIGGESSGGSAVAYHLLTNEGKPTDLFHQAILQSPGITQVKSIQAAQTNFEWALTALAAWKSPGCSQTAGYKVFDESSLFGRDSKIREASNDTIENAQAWCTSNESCVGFASDEKKGIITFYSKNIVIFDVEITDGSDSYKVYMKNGPVGLAERLACMESADASLLNSLTSTVPLDDTFQTDAYAPVVDNVYLKDSLMNYLYDSKKHLTPNITIMLGTNLDEGTEFMSLTPSIACNASARDFASWSNHFYGGTLGGQVPDLYSPEKLERPLPVCGLGASGEEAPYYNAAMRSAGDAAIRCPTALLAEANLMPSYMYLFTLTPAKSVNFDNTTTYGAFHGAEVPFVFGANFELANGTERALSRAMGCLWASFLATGDPNSGGCGNQKWPISQSSQAPSPYLELGASLIVRNSSEQMTSRCSHFLKKFFLADPGSKKPALWKVGGPGGATSAGAEAEAAAAAAAAPQQPQHSQQRSMPSESQEMDVLVV